MQEGARWKLFEARLPYWTPSGVKLVFYLSGIHLGDTGTVLLLRFGGEIANGGCRITGQTFAERLPSSGVVSDLVVFRTRGLLRQFPAASVTLKLVLRARLGGCASAMGAFHGAHGSDSPLASLLARLRQAQAFLAPNWDQDALSQVPEGQVFRDCIGTTRSY